MNCMDQAVVTLLVLHFSVNAIPICYLLPNTYINILLEGILSRKCVEVESLYGILWCCPALVGDISLPSEHSDTKALWSVHFIERL
jgi:hypothetical protein